MNECRRIFGRLDRRLYAWKSAWSPKMLSAAPLTFISAGVPNTIGSWWPMWAQRPWAHGAKISTVRDMGVFPDGGTGREYTQGTEVSKPTWEGSAGTPYFDGNDWLQRTGTTINPSAHSRLLIWAVIGRVPQTYSETIWNVGGWSTTVGYKLGREVAGDKWEFYAGNGYGAGAVGVRGLRTQNVAYLVAGIDSVSGGFMRENGVDRTTDLVNAAFPARTATTGYIGRSALGEHWVGAIAELGYVPGYTDQDVEQLEKYLKGFYGF